MPGTPGHRLRVAVTGAAGPVGSALVRALVEAPGIGVVLALDTVPVEVAGVRSIVVDVCDPAVRTALAGCAVVVHLDPDPVLALVPGTRPAGAAPPVPIGPETGPDVPEPPGNTVGGAPGHVEVGESVLGESELAGPVLGESELAGPVLGESVFEEPVLGEPVAGEPVAGEPVAAVPAGRAVLAAQTVLTAAAAANVGCAIVVTSAMVYGAGATTEVPIAEDAPLNAEPDGQAMRDMLEVERVVALAARAHRGLEVCVVRPAALAGPGVDSAVTRYFEAPRLVTVKGEAMRWQFCHVDDLVSALVALAVRGRGGVATVGCAGWLSQAEVERLADRGHVELPASLAYGTADRLHRMGLSPVPAGQLRFVTRPWVVPSTTLRDIGWRAGWDNADVLGLVLEQAAGHLALAWRRIGRKETATLSAAGATVAVLSTAAIVARARRRHR